MNKSKTGRSAFRILMLCLFIVYMGAIAYACFTSDIPDTKLPKQIFGIDIDKIVHFCMFIPFPILGTPALNFKGKYWRTLIIASLLAILTAFAVENLQSLLTEVRVTDPADLNANTLGIALGMLTMTIYGIARKID